jgi:hypothetical protein
MDGFISYNNSFRQRYLINFFNNSNRHERHSNLSNQGEFRQVSG